MSDSSTSATEFHYVIYIQASLEKVWAGLLEPEFTRIYWMHDNVSDWKAGSPWAHRRTTDGVDDIVGEVLESDPPNRLVLTWVPPADQGNAVKTSKVTFELALQEDWPDGPWTQLRLAHTEMEPDSDMLHSVSFGWPAVLSGLKTVLETGAVFDEEAGKELLRKATEQKEGA